MQTAIKVKSFGELNKVFLVEKIKDNLLAMSSTGLFADTVRHALYNKRPFKDVCKMVLDQYKADKNDTLFIVGQETINLIKSVYNENK